MRKPKGYRYPTGKLNSIARGALMGDLMGSMGGGEGAIDPSMEDALMDDMDTAALDEDLDSGPALEALPNQVYDLPTTNQVPNQGQIATPPAIAAPEFKVKGFGNHMLNVLTKGALSREAFQANQQAQLAQYNNQMRGAIQQQAQAAAMERLIKSGALKEAMLPKETEALRARALNEAAYKAQATPETYESDVVPTTLAKLAGERAGYRAVAPLYDTPEYIKSKQDALLSADAKQGVENERTKAAATLDNTTARVKSEMLPVDIDRSKAQSELDRATAAMKKYLNIGQGEAVLDTSTGQPLYNRAPQEFKQEIPGGLEGLAFRKTPGGILNEATQPYQSPVPQSPLRSEFRLPQSNPAPSTVPQASTVNSTQEVFGPPPPAKPSVLEQLFVPTKNPRHIDYQAPNLMDSPTIQNFINEKIVPLFPAEAQFGSWLRGGPFMPQYKRRLY